jgi:hypothetical protein
VAYPAEGVKVLDLETRSLLQVLYFLAHGVEVPPEHDGPDPADRPEPPRERRHQLTWYRRELLHVKASG